MEIIESRLWGKKINLIIDTSVEQRERERERGSLTSLRQLIYLDHLAAC